MRHLLILLFTLTVGTSIAQKKKTVTPNQPLQGIDTALERHCSNGLAIAEYLQQHPAVAHVNYAGFASHPDYATCMKQMKHPGPMLSFELKGGLEAGKKFIDALQMCVRAVSLGTVDTLISHPASMTHFGVSAEEKAKYGITDGLIRMSVGIEYVEDIKDEVQWSRLYDPSHGAFPSSNSV